MAIEEWAAPPRPVAYAEEALVTAILNGHYEAGATLPGERELARQLGVTRPTLREVLRRLEGDGWLTVRQGKSTVVNDIWREGGLNALGTLVRYADELPNDFIVNLLQVRLDLAPSYYRAAVENAPERVVALLEGHAEREDTAEAYAAFDWAVHRELTAASGNPIYRMILNGFAGFYEEMARLYFARPEVRQHSRRFYTALADAAGRGDLDAVEELTREVMRQSIEHWRQVR